MVENHTQKLLFFYKFIKFVPEIIDPVFVKTSPIRSFSMTENKSFGLVFTETRVYKFGLGTTEQISGAGRRRASV
jgi:hypothetical protein